MGLEKTAVTDIGRMMFLLDLRVVSGLIFHTVNRKAKGDLCEIDCFSALLSFSRACFVPKI